ncbi:HAD family phosphatase [Flavobacteriaceae bacterium]|nr:HAD family phosphatase [Flavobacteriaceae bacterium]MDC1337021.1 HAD family phosphatase [Flavobacteriaceae bacterium]|tara:strand:+ start:218 stop:874 length:657 start_codon:yes stop_codon:yes gene_type:complete
MLKAVIFDMDGVIVNSEPLHHLAYKKMFEEFKLDVSNSLYESFTGQSTYSICEQLCEIFDLKVDANSLVLSKRKHFKIIFENDSSFEMIDGAMNLIKDYFENNLTLVLASSASMTNIERIFKKFDLNKFFKAKISGADLKESKPNPEIFIKAAQLAGFKKEECIVIEDSTSGIAAAKSAQIYCVGYDSLNSKNQNYDKANLVINNFKEIQFDKISKLF